eukprot:scaffold88406_cov33-Phaeocystis_antarctica.AAC.1
MSQPVWSVTVHGRGFDVLRSNRSYLECRFGEAEDYGEEDPNPIAISRASAYGSSYVVCPVPPHAPEP